MQEKRLRKQELEEQARGSAEAEPLQKRTAERTLKKKTPARGSSSHTEASTPKIPVRKLISLKSKSAASFWADSQSPNSSKEKPDHQSKACVNVKPAGAAEEPEQEQPADPKGTDTSLTTITVALNRYSDGSLYPDHDPEYSLRLRVAAFEYLIILLKITSNN